MKPDVATSAGFTGMGQLFLPLRQPATSSLVELLAL